MATGLAINNGLCLLMKNASVTYWHCMQIIIIQKSVTTHFTQPSKYIEIYACHMHKYSQQNE